MDRQPTLRELTSAHILRQYQDAGRGFDGIHQMLLPHLRENRQAEPKPSDHAQLAADVAAAGCTDFPSAATSWSNFVIDGGVLLSYARLDNQTVGAALIDAVADPACQLVVSPLSYLRAAPALSAVPGGDRRVSRLLQHRECRVVDVPALTFPQARMIARLGSGERPDLMHTALLALRQRCVVGTLEPAAYHRLGYLRTLDLSESGDG